MEFSNQETRTSILAFDLQVRRNEGAIDFHNNTDEFVEVVFTINNKEVCSNREFSTNIRGYCYPPRYRRDIKKTRDGRCLLLGQSDTIKAYVYRGVGNISDSNINIPTFIRRRTNTRVRFRRLRSTPSNILEATS